MIYLNTAADAVILIAVIGTIGNIFIQYFRMWYDEKMKKKVMVESIVEFFYAVKNEKGKWIHCFVNGAFEWTSWEIRSLLDKQVAKHYFELINAYGGESKLVKVIRRRRRFVKR